MLTKKWSTACWPMSSTAFAGRAHWLDVLRYTDLDVWMAVMPAASGIYLWRDWVISALNSDMPYDEFVRAQILGSRYKEHTTLTATGYRVRVPGPVGRQLRARISGARAR